MLIPWIVLILEGLAVKLFFDLIPNENTLVSVIVIAVNALSLCVGIVTAFREKHDVIYMMLGGFLFRLALLFWDLNFRQIFLLPASGKDTESYAIWASTGFVTGEFSRRGVYPRFIAFWYGFFGVQRPIVQYINVLLAMTAISVVIGTMKYLQIDEGVSRIVTALMCFLPYSAIINAILLRETLIGLLVTCGLYFFFRYLKENSIPALLAGVAFVMAASAVHSGAIAVLLGEAVVLILYDRQERAMRVTPRSLVVTIALIIGFIAMYGMFRDVLFSKFDGIDSAEDIVSGVQKYNAGGSAYDIGIDLGNSTINLIVNSPIRMLYFITSPLPWNWRGVSDIVAFCFSSLLFIYGHFRSFVEIKNSPKNQERSMIMILTVIALCAALVFAWGVSNAGTAMRHREKFTMVYMLLIALCNDNRIRRMKSMPVRKKIGNDYET